MVKGEKREKGKENVRQQVKVTRRRRDSAEWYVWLKDHVTGKGGKKKWVYSM
jgi:hypothetical protein